MCMFTCDCYIYWLCFISFMENSRVFVFRAVLLFNNQASSIFDLNLLTRKNELQMELARIVCVMCEFT